MRKSRSREARLPTRLVGAAGLVTVVGAGAAVAGELRHRKAVASDPEWRLLRAPLRGATVSARSADGTELHAEVFGSADAPTFVLVPGWTEELQFFDLVTRGLLGRGFRVVCYDLRGQGSSGGAPGLDQAIERYGEDLAAVLDATCGGRDDVIVAGHSMGGMAIVAWAGAGGCPAGCARRGADLNRGVGPGRRGGASAGVDSRRGAARGPDGAAGERAAAVAALDSGEPRDQPLHAVRAERDGSADRVSSSRWSGACSRSCERPRR